jgi:hypothetical protein
MSSFEESVGIIRQIYAEACVLDRNAYYEAPAGVLGDKDKMYKILVDSFNAILIAKERTKEDYIEALRILLETSIKIWTDADDNAIIKLEQLCLKVKRAIELAHKE